MLLWEQGCFMKTTVLFGANDRAGGLAAAGSLWEGGKEGCYPWIQPYQTQTEGAGRSAALPYCCFHQEGREVCEISWGGWGL